MEDCIFCKIVKGEEKSNKVYETDKILAILDVNPISKGHLLVIPKEHYKDIFDISETILKEIIISIKKISEMVKENLGARGVNILHASREEAQQSVFHFHIHLVPRYKDDGLDTWPKSEYKELNFEEVAKKIKCK